MKKRFAAAAGSGSGFRRSLGALALMLSCGVFAAFSALPVPAAGPPPGMHHPGPGFGGPGHRPASALARLRPRRDTIAAGTLVLGTAAGVSGRRRLRSARSSAQSSIAPRRRAMLKSRCRRFPSRRAHRMLPRLPRHRALRIRQLSVVLVLERTRILPDRSLLPTRLGDRDGHRAAQRLPRRPLPKRQMPARNHAMIPSGHFHEPKRLSFSSDKSIRRYSFAPSPSSSS